MVLRCLAAKIKSWNLAHLHCISLAAPNWPTVTGLKSTGLGRNALDWVGPEASRAPLDSSIDSSRLFIVSLATYRIISRLTYIPKPQKRNEFEL